MDRLTANGANAHADALEKKQQQQHPQYQNHHARLRDWANSASMRLSHKEYIYCVVDLASALTKRLIQVMVKANDNTGSSSNGNGNGGAITIPATVTVASLRAISAENVLVLVQHDSASVGTLPTVDVQFQFQQPQKRPHYDDDAESTPLTSAAACFALGKILLELFSKGGSATIPTLLLAMNSRGSDSTNYGSIGISSSSSINDPGCATSQHYAEVEAAAGIMQPPRKKAAKMPPNYDIDGHSISGMANSLLIDVGMPLSICQLVVDLLSAENVNTEHTHQQHCSSSNDNTNNTTQPLTSLEEALWDLTRMKNDPGCFLFDRLCPQKALEVTKLYETSATRADGNNCDLFGREGEKDALRTAMKNISVHMTRSETNGGGEKPSSLSSGGPSPSSVGASSDFLCETVFLGGYAGSGKSALLRSLGDACDEQKWFVLRCKFDKQAANHSVVVKAIDNFFGQWVPRVPNNAVDGDGGMNTHANDDLDPAMVQAFQEVCRHIFCTVDHGMFDQLCVLIPNFAKVFPLISANSSRNKDKHQERDDILSNDKVGVAMKRQMYLIHIVVRSICSAGRPVIIMLDDLQWAEDFHITGMTDFICNFMRDTACIGRDKCRRGLIFASAYRSNEVKEGSLLLEKIDFIKQSNKSNFTMLNVGDLTRDDITKLISSKLCQPWRASRELADLVHSKTRGSPFFIIMFLKSIVQNSALEFSVKRRRWVWDLDVIDMQIMPDGVAELLTTRFNQLSVRMMQTLKIIACIGSQIEESTIDLLNLGQQVLPFHMQDELELATKEGLVEKAGPVYQFTHDLIQDTIYKLIPTRIQTLLHKTIGKSLLKSATNNPVIHLLAVDQINMFIKGGAVSPEERRQYADINASAAKFAIPGSNFEQARSYIGVGIQMLDTGHWEHQYQLSLDLFEMSASVSCNRGDTDVLETCIGEILSNARSFDDSLKASSLLVKLLTAQSKYKDAAGNCIAILSKLGEEIPIQISLPLVLNELSVIQTTLKDLTHEQIKLLPPMVNMNALKAMKFLNMLCVCSQYSNAKLLPVVACRMVRLTLEYGFCDDSIFGLAWCGYGLFSLFEDQALGYRISKVTESLIEESPDRHSLRHQLCFVLRGKITVLMEPAHSVVASYPELYNSAILAGDVESAAKIRWTHCAASLCIGAEMTSTSQNIETCIQEAAKHKQDNMFYSTMPLYHFSLFLSGKNSNVIDLRSSIELDDIGNKTSDDFLLWQNFFWRTSSSFWARDYLNVIELSEKYQDSQHKRSMDIFRALYQGIAFLNLARDTKQEKWKIKGQQAVQDLYKWAIKAPWNFENKYKLLCAELHYLNGDFESAEVAYRDSIKFAREHKVIHEVALAYELFGVFFVENCRVKKGVDQLEMALDNYKKWGAMKKVEELQLFIDLVSTTRPPLSRSVL